MKEITIYTTRTCPYCIRAKHLLDEKGLNYQEIAVDGNRELRAQMAEKAGRTSVPQIWIDDFHVGGCDDLMALNRSGQLDQILA